MSVFVNKRVYYSDKWNMVIIWSSLSKTPH